jgi:ppGpp synthetase/RelA/SpoT-type nucleotidyltranferase
MSDLSDPTLGLSDASRDAAWIDSVAWTAPEHTKEQINAAAKYLLLEDDPTWDWQTILRHHLEKNKSLLVINNFRSSHSYPLTIFQMTLRRYARKVDASPLIAQRIKRLSSIKLKLERFPTMKLSQMQDLGGCRAIVKSISAVRRLSELYDKSNIKHVRASRDNYLDNPQRSGYRGIHLVYRYFSDKNKTEYNGLKIEVQLRSQFQHAWATAVETVGTFVQQALKSSAGESDWLRFFALMGSVIAIRERSALVPNTPTSRNELLAEIRDLARKLDVKNRLKAYGDALQTLRGERLHGTDLEKSHYYLLVLDPGKGTLTVSGFSQHELVAASDAYLEAEKQVRESPGTDAVLVSVDSLAALERAYPNYFADTRVFIELLDQALSGHPRRVHIPGQLRFNLDKIADA